MIINRKVSGFHHVAQAVLSYAKKNPWDASALVASALVAPFNPRLGVALTGASAIIIATRTFCPELFAPRVNDFGYPHGSKRPGAFLAAAMFIYGITPVL